MDIFISVNFWIIVVITYVLVHIKIFLPLSTRFGFINIIGIYLLFGKGPACLLVGLSLGLWLLLNLIVRFKERKLQKSFHVTVWLSLVVLAAVFIFYKLNIDINYNNKFALNIPAEYIKFLVTISFSYIYLRVIDLIRAVAWGGVRIVNPMSLAGFLAPFHMVISGPINSYSEHIGNDQALNPAPSFSKLLSSVNTIVTGLFFKLVIAQGMKIFAFGTYGSIEVNCWIDSAFVLFYIFFDFAGYSLVALGIGRLCNIPTPENFKSPFFSTSITDFWTRWHISFGVFVRKNIFNPLQLLLVRSIGRKYAVFISFFVLVTSFSFVALWHRLTLSLFFWGFSMGLIMVLEKSIRDKFLKTNLYDNKVFGFFTRMFGPVYVFLVIATGFYYVSQDLLGV